MSETTIRVSGVLLTDPFPYQSVEEREEVYLAKFAPSAPLPTHGAELTELYLNFGTQMPDLQNGAQVQAAGVLTERKMVNRSGKVRRGGMFQLLVQEWHQA